MPHKAHTQVMSVDMPTAIHPTTKRLSILFIVDIIVLRVACQPVSTQMTEINGIKPLAQDVSQLALS